MRIKRQSSPNLSSISESWKNDWNEDSEPKRFLPPYKDGDDRGSDKNLTRSGGEEKRCSKRKKGEGGREGGRRSWQRGRVYDSALYAKGERGDSETRYYPTVLLPWRPARRRAADVDGRPAPASSTGHFRTVKRQRRVSLFFFFLLFLLRR